jgi:hypothetical protein
MSLGQVTNDGNKKWESVRFVSFEDVEEVVVLKETHGSVSDLQMKTRNAFHQPLENFWNVGFKFRNLACFEDFDQF